MATLMPMGSKLPQNITDDVEKRAVLSTVATNQSGMRVGSVEEIIVHGGLKRGLEGRHLAMIAIAGSIGTGLLIGTGQALAESGPAAIFIAYSIIGFVVFIVLCAIGEMAAWLPLPSGFTGYATRFVDPALGFALGYTYWFKYLILTPNQLTAAALVLQYWVPRTKVNPGVFIAVFLVVIVLVNLVGISFFGELEFWMAVFKVLTLAGVILLCLVLACGGGPNHDATGFRYYSNPGAFNPVILTGASGNFLAVWSAMVTALFAFLGTELIGVTVGEAQNPRRVIPRAVKMTFGRIVFFYVVNVFLLGLIVPYNSKQLIFANNSKLTTASASPYVVAIQLAGIHVLPGFLNGCILLFVFSASNSDLYIASRTIYGLAREGHAPAFLKYTNNRGTPVYALGLSAAVACLAFLNVSNNSKVIFGYFVYLVTVFGVLTWISILLTHVFFIRARRAQGITNAEMPYVAPLGIWGSVCALFICILIAIFKNFGVFIPSPSYGKFDYKNFITGYLGIPLYLILLFASKLVRKTKRVTSLQADFFSGKAEIDAEERAFLEHQTALGEAKGPRKWYNNLYHYVLGWLF